MREIKFRAWEKIKKVMRSRAYPAPANGVSFYDDEHPNWPSTYDPIASKYILMQYTGLKDKNGKEIYEGDIVEDSGLIGDIRFENGAFSVWWFKNIPEGWNHQYIPVFMGMDNSEVIGNIYENPELVAVVST